MNIEEQEKFLGRAVQLQDEDYETLKALNSSPYWLAYRKILLNAKEAYFNSILPENDPNKVMKISGMVAGINLAINQLPVLVAAYEAKKLKRVQEAEAKAKAKAPEKGSVV